MRLILVGLLAVALAACATVNSNTASGHPEVTVAGSGAAVKAFITSEMINKGYAPHSSSDEMIVFDKLAPANAGSTWMALSVGPLTMRTSFTIVQLGNSVRVVGTPAMEISARGIRAKSPWRCLFDLPGAASDFYAVLASVSISFPRSVIAAAFTRGRARCPATTLSPATGFA